MISGKLLVDKAKVRISAESIYSWIYSRNDPEKIELRKYLIRKHKKRGLKAKKSKSKIKNRVSIHDRPNYKRSI
jgi:IS30 family transposase